MKRHEEDQRLAMLLEHCREFVALVDQDGRLIEEWSPAQERELGYAPNELRGTILWDLVHPGDLPALRQALASVLLSDGACEPFSCRVRSSSGDWRQLEGTLTNRLNEPLLSGVVINWHDVTAQRQSEKRAAEAEVLLARLFEEAPIGMIIATMDRVIRRVNPVICASLGYTPEELLRADPHSLVDPGDYERILNQVQPVREGRLPALRTEARFRDKNGRVVWMDVAAFYMRDQQGRPERVVGLLRDITKEKEATQELEASYHRIQQLASVVVEAREQERASIAREIHDELGQLLTGLRMEVEQLRHDHLPECPRQDRMVARIDRLCEHVQEALGWVQRIAVELRPGILRHLGLVKAIEWQAERFENETGIKCRLDLPFVDIELAEGQATTVFRIFQEALTNVARHSRAKQVTVRLYTTGDRVVLTVKDDGKGLPADLSGHPLSVGLAGMQERAAQYGGRLRFFSRPGVGTTATLRLPKMLPKNLAISANLW